MNGKFSVRPPGSQSLQRGEILDFPIELDRRSDDDSVTLRIEDLPPGLLADEVHFHRGESRANCRLRAGRDAELVAMHEARIVPRGEDAPEAQRIRVTVTEATGEGRPDDPSGTGSETPKGSSLPASRTKAGEKSWHPRTPAERDDDKDDEDRDYSKPGFCCQ